MNPSFCLLHRSRTWRGSNLSLVCEHDGRKQSTNTRARAMKFAFPRCNVQVQCRHQRPPVAPAAQAALVLHRRYSSPASMPSNEYDAEATELLETYGAPRGLSRTSLEYSHSFTRLPYEVHYNRCGSPLRITRPLAYLLTGEAGTGKSCLLHHFTHNSCP